MQRLNSKRKSPVAISRFSLSTHFQFSVSILFQMSLAASNRQLTKMNELVFCWCFHKLQINCMQHMFELQGTVSVFSSIENLCNAVTICLQHVQKTIRSVFVLFSLDFMQIINFRFHVRSVC